MKAYVKFDLSDPDDKENYELFIKAQDFMLSLYDFDQYLRQIVKYGSEENQKLDAQAVRDKLWEILNERDINKFI